MMMANGNNSWQQILVKQGLAGLGLAAMGFVIYAFVLIPSAHEREVFTKTAIENAKSMGTVADSTEDISASVQRQEATMSNIDMELEKQSDLRETAMDTMSAFADEMRQVNPGNSEKLDALMKKIMGDDTWTKQLKELNDKLDQYHPEPEEE